MYTCKDCGNLNKSKKETSNKCYRYGCNARENYICGWLQSDSELNYMGCTNWSEESKEFKGQITMEEVLKNV